MSYFFNGSSSSGSIITFGEGAVVRYPFAISAWVYPLRTTAEETIISLLSSTTGDTWRLTLTGSSAPSKVSALSFNGSTSGFASAGTTANYVANKWQFVMARFDGNTNRVAFLDAQTPGSNGTDSLQTGQNTISTMYIGRDAGTTRNFQGYIADVSVRWSRTGGIPAIVNSEVLTRLAFKQNPLKVRGNNVVLYWPLTSPGPQKNKSPNGANLNFPLNNTSFYVEGNNPGVQSLNTSVAKIYYLGPMEVKVSITGISATGSVGTATTQQNVTYPVTGLSATGSVGTALVQGSVTRLVTGTSATGAVGTATTQQNVTYPVTGLSATGAVGTATTQQNVTYPVTGLSTTGSTGTATVIIGQLVAPGAVSATGSVGTVTTQQNVAYPVTGLSTTGLVGLVSVATNQTILPTGVSSTGSVGTATASVQLIIQPSGVYATGRVGSVIVWTPISPNQNPNWSLVDDSQTGAWTTVNDSQTTVWSRVA